MFGRELGGQRRGDQAGVPPWTPLNMYMSTSPMPRAMKRLARIMAPMKQHQRGQIEVLLTSLDGGLPHEYTACARAFAVAGGVCVSGVPPCRGLRAEISGPPEVWRVRASDLGDRSCMGRSRCGCGFGRRTWWRRTRCAIGIGGGPGEGHWERSLGGRIPTRRPVRVRILCQVHATPGSAALGPRARPQGDSVHDGYAQAAESV
jgi:hypothetical protein